MSCKWPRGVDQTLDIIQPESCARRGRVASVLILKEEKLREKGNGGKHYLIGDLYLKRIGNLHAQTGEVPCVPSNENQIMMQGGGCNNAIHDRQGYSLLLGSCG